SRAQLATVVGTSSGDPLVVEVDEVGTHRVEAADRHRAAPNREVERGKLGGALEVTLGGFRLSALVQVPGEGELGARALLVGGRQHLLRTRGTLLDRLAVFLHPGA